MVKKRILTSLYLICLAAIGCNFATATSQVDCRHLHAQECDGDYRSNPFCCYLNLFNVSTNEPVIRNTINVSQLWFTQPISIVSARTDNDDVKVRCYTQSITLELHKDYQRAGDLNFHIIYRYKYINFIGVKVMLVSAKIYDVRLTDQVIQTGQTKQIILNCSVTGIYNTDDITEFKFNDNDSYTCSQPSESGGSTEQPYTHLLNDGTTCQLIIPKATKSYFVDYQCRVKFKFLTGCYTWSEITTPYEEAHTTTPSGGDLTPEIATPYEEVQTTTPSGEAYAPETATPYEEAHTTIPSGRDLTPEIATSYEEVHTTTLSGGNLTPETATPYEEAHTTMPSGEDLIPETTTLDEEVQTTMPSGVNLTPETTTLHEEAHTTTPSGENLTPVTVTPDEEVQTSTPSGAYLTPDEMTTLTHTTTPSGGDLTPETPTFDEEAYTTTPSGEDLTPKEVLQATTDLIHTIASENDPSNTILTLEIAIVFAVVLIVLIIAVAVVKGLKYCCEHRQSQQPANPELRQPWLDRNERREGNPNNVQNGYDVHQNEEEIIEPGPINNGDEEEIVPDGNPNNNVGNEHNGNVVNHVEVDPPQGQGNR